MSSLDYEKAARAVSELKFATSEDIICKRYDISLRTLQRWRKRAETDPKLAQLVTKRQAIILPDWKKEVTATLRKGLSVIESQMEAARGEPRYLGDTAKTLQVIGELVVTNEILEDDIALDFEGTETEEVETRAQTEAIA